MALKNLRGRVAFIFDEINFDVDQIVGVKNIKITDIDELAQAAMQAYDPDFRTEVKPGDVIVGNHNFGYGHPHYPPMRAMRHLGISGVIAKSFSPGYWRGEISMGFPQASCPEFSAWSNAGTRSSSIGRPTRCATSPKADPCRSNPCPTPTARCSMREASSPI